MSLKYYLLGQKAWDILQGSWWHNNTIIHCIVTRWKLSKIYTHIFTASNGDDGHKKTHIILKTIRSDPLRI